MSRKSRQKNRPYVSGQPSLSCRGKHPHRSKVSRCVCFVTRSSAHKKTLNRCISAPVQGPLRLCSLFNFLASVALTQDVGVCPFAIYQSVHIYGFGDLVSFIIHYLHFPVNINFIINREILFLLRFRLYRTVILTWQQIGDSFKSNITTY